MQAGEIQRVELGSVELAPNGETFVLGLVGANQQTLRMEMPSWTVHQLMRVLPRLDAVLCRSALDDDADLVAHRALQWSVQTAGADGTVALCVQSDQRVESAFSFAQQDAVALHAALGEALSARSVRSAA